MTGTMRVHVYRNLATGTWSAVAREGAQKGKVVDRPDVVTLADATFRVRPAGRDEVRRTCSKGVHAGVDGAVIEVDALKMREIFTKQRKSASTRSARPNSRRKRRI